MSTDKQKQLPKINLFTNNDDSVDGKFTSDGRAWSAARLYKLFENEPVYDVPLRTFPLWTWQWEDELTLMKFLRHAKRVKDADLKYPILISPDGCIIDGVHRLCKAILEEKDTIKVIYIPKMPEPDCKE